MRSRLTGLTLATLAAWTLAARVGGEAAEPGLQTAAEIDACLRAPLAEGSIVQSVTFRTRDRSGNEAGFDGKIYWKRFDDGFSRVLMRVTAPAETQGTALLLIQKADRNDVFLYAPELKRVRRVTNRMISSSILGTDFSYEDFQRLHGLARDGGATRLSDAEVRGRRAYVIEVKPESSPESGSAYGRVRSWVDQDTCALLRVEYFENDDKPRKVLEVDPANVEPAGDRFIPRKIFMTDRRQQTSTELVIHEIELGVPLRSGLFGTRELEFGKE